MKDNPGLFNPDYLKVEEALNESEAFNAALFKFAPYPILITNLDGSIRYVNPALEALTGHSSEDIIGLNPPFPWWPPETGLEYKMNSRYFEKADTFRAERRFIRKNGETFWVMLSVKEVIVNGQPRFYLSSWVDFTERRKAEDRVKENERQLLEILNALTEGVSMISPDLTVMQANQAERRIMGTIRQEASLRDFFRNHYFKHISARGVPVPTSKSPVVKAIKKKKPVVNFEEGVVYKDGTVKWLNVCAVPITDDSGRVISVVRTITDITEQKRLREEREQFTKKLLEVQEEERKRISRELHDDTAQYLSLLTLEISSLIEKERVLGSPNVPQMEMFLNTAEKALQEVRRFSHELRPNVLEEVGLASAIELIINEFNGICGAQVDFSCSGSETRLSEENELALFRITQEALNNIRKHAEATKAEVRLGYHSGKVNLTISDNGKGFEYSPVHGPNRSGGLGLIGMRERANLIGANLTLKSQPGKGTVVSVALTLKKGYRRG
jgi:PAS domain S-box-containing protein